MKEKGFTLIELLAVIVNTSNHRINSGSNNIKYNR